VVACLCVCSSIFAREEGASRTWTLLATSNHSAEDKEAAVKIYCVPVDKVSKVGIGL
jgi:hypothetical protein